METTPRELEQSPAEVQLTAVEARIGHLDRRPLAWAVAGVATLALAGCGARGMESHVDLAAQSVEVTTTNKAIATNSGSETHTTPMSTKKATPHAQTTTGPLVEGSVDVRAVVPSVTTFTTKIDLGKAAGMVPTYEMPADCLDVDKIIKEMTAQKVAPPSQKQLDAFNKDLDAFVKKLEAGATSDPSSLTPEKIQKLQQTFIAQELPKLGLPKLVYPEDLQVNPQSCFVLDGK